MRETKQAPGGIDQPITGTYGRPPPPDEYPRVGRMQFRILGSLEVDQGGSLLPLGGPRQRAVLAHLLIRANELVPADVLVDEIWGDVPPEAARNTLYTYVSRLRKVLGADRIHSQAPGYRLRLDPSELDAARFDKLLEDAGKARAIDPGIGATVLDEALGLWRGPALADVAGDGALLAEATRLDELRLVAGEERIDALLATGEQARVIGEAELLIDRHPLRERIWRQLMLALYREGRQAEALNAYQRVREVLADELGIDPSPELARLHERILQQDPGLELRGEPLRGYRLLEKIDDGPTGVVFRAIQPRVGRDVAVKIVHEQVASDPAFVRRFEQEAQAAASLEHPHIVPIYDYWREPGRAYVVSRYLKGGSLATLQSRGERLQTDQALVVVDQIASALAFAHRQRVTHGRIRASNVLFDGERNAYLGDFRVGVGSAPDPVDDIRDLASLVRDVFDEEIPPGIGDLIERAQLGTETIAAETFSEAARTVFEPDAARSPRLEDVRNPFKGLRAFTEADAHDFFGRAELTARLVSRMGDRDGRRFLAVVGPSGGGKSSVVRAGLVPVIRAGALGDSGATFVTEMFPGVHPMAELEDALARIGTHAAARLRDLLDQGSRGLLEAIDLVLPAPAELVLVVDQFEEVFTVAADEAERELFLESLRVATADPESRLRVVITLRADFYDRPLVYPRFGELLAACTEAVPPLTPDELEQAIRRPAEGVGISAEPGLEAEIIADVAHQPGALPLLQYALTELFERRDDDRLTLTSYQGIGGVGGALAARADRILEAAGPEAKRTARQVFLRLVALGEGRQDTRRRVLRSELDSLEVEPEAVDQVLDAYGRHRLLTFDREPVTREPTVEIAHEALLTVWKRLRAWIDDAREDLRQDRRLSRAAGEWQGAERDPSLLLRGARLEQVEAWTASTDLALGRSERKYLKASVDLRDRELEEERARREREERTERRSRSTLRALVAVLSVAALVAATLTVVATNQRERADREATKAQDEARVATARELANAAVANLETDPELSILLAIEAIDRTRSFDGSVLPEAEDALHQAVGASRIELTVPGVGGAIAWAPGGMFAAESAEGEGIVEIRSAETGGSVLSIDAHEGDVSGLAFSRDGTMLATSGADGSLNVWDASTGGLRHSLRGDGVALNPAFSSDGSRVAATWRGDVTTMRIARVATGQVTEAYEVPRGPLAFSPDLSRIAMVGGKPAIIELRTGHRTEFAGSGMVSWSPDGRYIATGDWTYGAVFDPTGRHLFDFHHDEVINGLGWSEGSRCAALANEPTSTCLVTGGTATAKVWPILRGDAEVEVSVSPRFPGVIDGVAISPDGKRLITSDGDVTATKIWDVSDSGDTEVADIPGAYYYPDVAFMPDGERVARLVDGRRSIAIWDLETGRNVRRMGPAFIDLFGSPHAQLEVSADGTSIAVFGDGGAEVWDVASSTKTLDVPKGQLINQIEWDPNGRRLIMGSLHGWGKIVDRTGREIQVLREDEGYSVVGVEFSADGRSVAMSARPEGEISGLEGRTTIWDLAQGEVTRTIDGIASEIFAFSPDGARIVNVPEWWEGPAEVWDVQAGERLAVLHDKVNEVAFSPDGSRIAAALNDATVRLYDAASFEEQLVLRGHVETASWLDFSPDGTTFVTGGGRGMVRVWALDIDDLLEIARGEATRSFTDEECRRFLHLGRCADS